MNCILLGMPGSGKGTQAKFLSEKLNIPLISTGDCFRNNIKNNTELGQQVKSILDSGELVPDEITFAMLKSELEKMDISQGVILDGFPRTVKQAELLEDYLHIDTVLQVNLSEEQVLLRIGGRRTCEDCGAGYHIKFMPTKMEGICDKCGGKLIIRDDAQEDVIKNRIEVYNEQTKPLQDFYEEHIININGDLSIPEVTNEIFNKLEIS